MKTLLVIALLFASFAAFGEASKEDTLYLHGSLGAASLGDSTNLPDSIKNEKQKKEGGIGASAGFGYRWKVFGFEFLTTYLGKMENNINSYMTETHRATFIGGGGHWSWSWFDVKLGVGNVIDTMSYRSGPNATSFSASPNGKTRGWNASYLGIGGHVRMRDNSELLIEYTSYSWYQDRARNLTVNGTSSSKSKLDYSAGVLSVGVRWFL